MARGNEHDIFASITGEWSSNDGDTTSAQFKIGYSHVAELANGQTDGYVSCSLIIQDEYDNWRNSGLTIRFYLDSENEAANVSDFDAEDNQNSESGNN
jgi:hypothetical protein